MNKLWKWDAVICFTGSKKCWRCAGRKVVLIERLRVPQEYRWCVYRTPSKTCSWRSACRWWHHECSPWDMTRTMHTHTHTQIQTGTSQGNIIMTGVKPCFPHVSSATFLCAHLRKTDVWETLCVSVAGSHVAAPTQVLRLWSDPRSARWGVHSCLSKVPVSQPWAITLVSLSSKIVKTGRFWVRGERRDQHTLERREN